MNVAFSDTTCITGLTIGEVIYDPHAWSVASAANTGRVNVGTDHDTATFAVESARRWWNGTVTLIET